MRGWRTCILRRIHQIAVSYQEKALVGWDPAGRLLGGPELAPRGDHVEERQSEATRKEVVNDGVHGRAEIEENT